MSGWELILIGLALVVVFYAAFVGWLLLSGRRSAARALAGFIPDCIVLFRRLLADRSVSRWRKFLLGGLLVYLALPFDLVPDFIPVAGQLDDALMVALVLRIVLRGGGAALVREHWPGPESSLRVVVTLAYGRETGARPPRVGMRSAHLNRRARPDPPLTRAPPGRSGGIWGRR